MTLPDLYYSLAETIGKTLMHSIWIGFVLLSLLKLLLHAIPQRYASLRYRLTGLTLLVFTGAVAYLFYFLLEPPGEVITGAISMTDGVSGMEKKFGSLSGDEAFPLSFWNLISYLYFAGFIWMILRFCFSLFHLRYLKKSGQAPGPDWSERLEKMALRIGIRRKITLLESHRVTATGIFGWLKPVIIVPGGMLTQMPLDQVETILMHELYHLKRFDYLVNLLQIAAETLFFYHPAIWMISRLMRVEREHCCDDLVLSAGNPPLLYAKALSTLSAGHVPRTRLVTSAGGPGQYSVYRRISRILNVNPMKTDIRERLFAMALLFAGISVMILLNGFSSGISILKNSGMDPRVIPVENGTFNSGIHRTQPPVPAAWSDTIPLDHEPEKLQPENTDELMELPEVEENQEIDIHVDMDVDPDVDIDIDIDEEVRKAISGIDWEAMKREVEQAQTEAFEEIDWEAMKQDIQHSIEEIDWEGMQQEIKQSMEEIDWEGMQQEIKQSMEEIDWEGMQQEVKQSMEEIDWDQLRLDMEQVKVRMDSLRQEHDWDIE